MRPPPRRIRVISDGRPGHENQSVGLALAIARRAGSEMETLRLPAQGWLWARCRAAAKAAGEVPDLLIGAGHKVHLPLWHAARKFGARSVVIMKPTWPVRLFDLCLVPRHDLGPGRASTRVIPTLGAVNRVPEDLPPKQLRGLILVGGPSRQHGWSGEVLTAAIVAVLAARPELEWIVADSRRTPPEFLAQLGRLNLHAELMPHGRTGPQWLPEQLAAAQEVWVTADSVSMIFEAVTAGARTGLLPAPVLKPDADPIRAAQELVRDGFATTYEAWTRNGRTLPPPKRLHETARCAELVLERLFAGPGP